VSEEGRRERRHPAGATGRTLADGARVLTAERAGGPGPSQDRIVVLPHAVAVLDGATGSPRDRWDGGWYAGELAAALQRGLATGADQPLPDLLAAAIAAVAGAHGLPPGDGPSSTVALLRWDTRRLEALVLGDSPVVAFPPGAPAQVLDDDRLATTTTVAERAAYKAHLASGGGYGGDHRANLDRLVEAQRRCRNRPGGYWIAEADPAAAHHAVVRSWPVTDLESVLVATDGVANGVLRYGVPPTWADALTLARAGGPGALLEAVHAAEVGDPGGSRWPRSKAHDDKSVVLLLPAAER
jgi:hypothetical protein